MTQIILKDDIAERVIEQARLKDFDTPEAYLAHLIKTDAKIDTAFYLCLLSKIF